MRNSIWFFGLLVVVLVACKRDKTEYTTDSTVNYLEIDMQPMFGTDSLLLDHPYETAEGYKVQFTDIKCYFSTIQGDSVSLADAALFDYRNSGAFVLKQPGVAADFPLLYLFVGVDSSLNHLDPSAFPNDSPLNISNANDMHWDWNPGYIFVKIEAKVDTLNDGIDNYNHYVVFHSGTDTYLQTLQLNNLNWVTLSGTLAKLYLKLDMQQFLQDGSDNIDLKTEYITHSASGQEALTLKVIEHFRDAISTF